MTVAEVLAEILRDRIFYDDSSGGSDLLRRRAFSCSRCALAALRACRSREHPHGGGHTSGYSPQDVLLAAARWSDLFLYDLKILDDQRHRRFTGVSNRLILDNLRALGHRTETSGCGMPLVPGVNDAPGDLEAVARLAASVPGVRQINLLPYHAAGAGEVFAIGQNVSRRPSSNRRRRS